MELGQLFIANLTIRDRNDTGASTETFVTIKEIAYDRGKR